MLNVSFYWLENKAGSNRKQPSSQSFPSVGTSLMKLCGTFIPDDEIISFY